MTTKVARTQQNPRCTQSGCVHVSNGAGTWGRPHARGRGSARRLHSRSLLDCCRSSSCASQVQLESGDVRGRLRHRSRQPITASDKCHQHPGSCPRTVEALAWVRLTDGLFNPGLLAAREPIQPCATQAAQFRPRRVSDRSCSHHVNLGHTRCCNNRLCRLNLKWDLDVALGCLLHVDCDTLCDFMAISGSWTSRPIRNCLQGRALLAVVAILAGYIGMFGADGVDAPGLAAVAVAAASPLAVIQ